MTLPDWIRILQVGFGIGAVIFVHEMGHFLAARWCGVRVEVFSLGFGPKVFGFRRGGTQYQIAAVPFGGYVRMAGELPDGTGRPPADDELPSKSVPQRFLIYSGGVIMNMVFALVLFPVAFYFGISSSTPIVTAVPGTPAWHAGIPRGSRVLSANGKEVFDWLHIPTEVAIGGSDPVELVIQAPGADAPERVVLVPERNEAMGIFMVGLAPAVDPELRFEVRPDGPAARAGMQDGDVLLEVLGGLPGFPVEVQYQRAYGDGPLDLLVQRGDETVEIHLEPELSHSDKRRFFGISPVSNLVTGVRADSITELIGLRAEDRILAVDGKPVYSNDAIFRAISSGQGPLSLEVQRAGEQNTQLKTDALTTAERAALLDNLALGQDETSARLLVSPESGAAAVGMQDGDLVLALDGIPIDELVAELSESKVQEPGEDLDEYWGAVQDAARRAVDTGDELAFTLDRNGQIIELSASAAAVPVLDYGMGLAESRYIYSTKGLVPSVKAGALASWRFLSEVWLTLKKMFQQEVSTKNLGGIITIGQVSYHWSAMGWTKLLFFLCMVSVNLAFLNVLPIPVLDGGHLFFLLVEGIKGSPVSERTLGYSQVVGVVLILSLMVYVTYQDILRLVG